MVACVTASFGAKVTYGVDGVGADNDGGGVAVVAGGVLEGANFTGYYYPVFGEEAVGNVEFLGIEDCEVCVAFYDAVYAGDFVGGGDAFEGVGTVVTGFEDFQGGMTHVTAEAEFGVGNAKTNYKNGKKFYLRNIQVLKKVLI